MRLRFTILSAMILGLSSLPLFASNGTVPFLAAGTVVTGAGPNAMATGDFNHDGKSDIVVVDSGVSKLMVLLGAGNGQFAAGVNYPGPEKADAVQVADMNGDGNLDLIAVGQGTNGTGSLTVLLGNGDGTFQTPTTYSLSAKAYDLAVTDLNHDGFPDVAISTSGSGLMVLLNNGSGGLNSPTTYSVNGPSTHIIAGDFNGDGSPDLIALNGIPYYLPNHGDGTFGAAQRISTPSSLEKMDVSAGDYNGDGKLDLAISGILGVGNGQVGILFGNGDGTFQPATLYATEGNASDHLATSGCDLSNARSADCPGNCGLQR